MSHFDDDEPVVTNAADKRQLRSARKREKDGREDELNDVRAILALPEGRRFLWRVLGFCDTFGSVLSESATVMGHRSGMQDVGHFLFAEIGEADPAALVSMMNDNRKE